MIGRVVFSLAAFVASCGSVATAPTPEPPPTLPSGCVRLFRDADHELIPPGSQFYGAEGSWWAPDGSFIGWAEQEDGAVYNVKGCGPVYE